MSGKSDDPTDRDRAPGADFPEPDGVAGMLGDQILLGEELNSAEAGGRVVRGGAIRATGHMIGMVAALAGSIVVLRYLGVARYGEYIAVLSIISIVDGLSEAGLTALGNRDLAVMKSARDRRRLLGDLLGLRLALTPMATAVAVIATILLGYPQELVLGTAIAGLSWTVFAVSNSLALPLAVDLRIGIVTALDLAKQIFAMGSAVLLAVVGADLLPFFATLIPGSALAIGLIPLMISRDVLSRPTFNFDRWRRIVARALPITIGAIVGVFYVRLLVILMFQFSSDYETGLFGASARVIEALTGLPLLAFMVALPLMAASNQAGDSRLTYVTQRMLELGVIYAWFCVVVLFVGATPIIELIGGSAYAEASDVLRIQAFAIVGTLVATACLMAAVALDHRRSIVIANGSALLVAVTAGIPVISMWHAQGAAAVAVIGELVIAVAYLITLRASGKLKPDLRPLWKSALAGVVAVVLAELTGLSAVIETAIAAIIFSAVILVTRAVPSEIFSSIFRRVPNGS